MSQALPPPPELPDPGDCCGGGCERCVFDVYDERMSAWKQAVAELEAAAAAEKGQEGSGGN